MDGQAPTTPPTTQPEVGETSDHTTIRRQQDHDFINDRDLRNDQYDYDDGQIDWSREDDQDQTDDQFNNDDRQVVHEIVPIPIQQPRQSYRQNQDQRDRSWGRHILISEGPELGSALGDRQSGVRDRRKCYRCGQRGHIKCELPWSLSKSRDSTNRERVHIIVPPNRETTRQHE
ncbi:hypothetical protein Sjap_013476 [Stephania japonica]|uniref:CCHC-type domain-containing protein n=1 Tax=Stephania japonica TaxID=461633 RepID=A0AAP0IXZ0_9MAGN